MPSLIIIALLVMASGALYQVSEYREKVLGGKNIEGKLEGTTLDNGASVLGVTIVPVEVLEDSRCLESTSCIQAGKVRVRVLLFDALGNGPAHEHVFISEVPITYEGVQIVLSGVSPLPETDQHIGRDEYRFAFEVVPQ